MQYFSLSVVTVLLLCWNTQASKEVQPKATTSKENEQCKQYTSSGMPGIPGIPGAPGSPGRDGFKGDKGATGKRGLQGAIGIPGKIGPRGPEGLKGEKGKNGTLGVNGSAGIPGNSGPRGLNGSKGKKGQKGETGWVGSKGSTGIPGNSGPRGPKGPKGETGGIGTKGEKGNAANIDPRQLANWKQCAWIGATGTDNGKINECSFNKLYSNTALKVSYQGNIQAYTDNACNRWYFKFNGNECSGPMTIDSVLYTNWAGGISNIHRHLSFEGYCENLARGTVRVELWVGQCPAERQGNAYTGWNSVSRIMIEEVPPSQ